MTMRWPRCFSAMAAMARIDMSVLPPGGQGTMKVTGRLG
jgi:hypothetical protein